MVISNKEVLKNQRTIISLLQEIKDTMSTTNTNAQLGFADVQQAITQLVNDNTASNNAIASQIQEVQGLLLDVSNKTAAGNAPSQADFQTAISQLAAIHSTVQANTAQVQATTTAIQQADPNALQSAQGTSGQSGASGAGSSSTSGVPQGVSTPSGAPTTTPTSASGGSTVSEGTPNPSGAGGATVEENSSSGLGS